MTQCIDGILIINVQKGTSAEAAGLRGTRQRGGEIILGDIIISVNNKPVSSYDDLRNEFDKYRIGDVIDLGIIRDEKRMTISVKLEEVQ
ncbi:MAG TPA: PDZ domain-containing protein [Thermodesulfovibrionales bacterium]|nr:PDZ domain-containing protein [Thermodesulfovibrionales bacterium]